MGNTTPVSTDNAYLQAVAFQQLLAVEDRLIMVNDTSRSHSISKVRARTLLLVAQKIGKLETFNTQLLIKNDKEYATVEAKVVHWAEDRPLIDYTLDQATQADGDEDDRDKCVPYVNIEDVESGRVKGVLAYNPNDMVPWSRIKGWLYIFNPGKDPDMEAVQVSKFLSESSEWLNRPTRVDPTDGRSGKVVGPEQKMEHILLQRKASQDFTNTFLSLKRS